MFTPRFFGFKKSAIKSFVTDRTEVVSDLSQKLSDQDPVSYGVPLKVSTITSVAGWDVPRANGDIAVSMISTPASTAFSMSWKQHLMCSVYEADRKILLLSGCTSSVALYGTRRPAISLIQIESAPISSILLQCLSSNPVCKHHLMCRKVLSVHGLFFVCCVYCCLKVTKIVQTVKNTDDIDSVCRDFCTKYSTTSSAYGRYPRCSVHGTASEVLCF